jgi:hypothetical protein
MTKHTVSKLTGPYGDVVENEYVYRGVEFERDDSHRGYWGHYKTSWNVGGTRIRTATRKDLLSAIDRYFDNKQKDVV